MRLLISLGLLGSSVLLYRWGMGVSSPRHDSLYVLRVIGWTERMLFKVDGWLSRVKVGIIDRLELDRVAWARMRAAYEPSMS